MLAFKCRRHHRLGCRTRKQSSPPLKTKPWKSSGTESLKVSRWRAARGSVVSFHQNTIALSDVVGEKELKTTTVGGRFPQDIGFREPQDLLDEIGQQILELESISQGR